MAADGDGRRGATDDGGGAPPAAADPPPPSATATLQRKVQKVLQLRPDQVRDELKTLSKFLAENTAVARRNLRASVEAEVLKTHGEFLSKFSPIEKALEQLEEQIEDLAGRAERAGQELSQSRQRTSGILAEAGRLREKKLITGEKMKICETFLSKFRLSEEELSRIRGSEHPIDDEFFNALEKIEVIRANCKLVVEGGGGPPGTGEDGGPSLGEDFLTTTPLSLLNQTSAFDVLQETGEILDIAFERLFISVQQQCRRLGNEGLDTSTPSIPPGRRDNHRVGAFHSVL